MTRIIAVDMAAKTLELDTKGRKSFKVVSTKKIGPQYCFACVKPADKMANLSVDGMNINIQDVPFCSGCLCIYSNGSQR